jgi:hypothetical protein
MLVTVSHVLIGSQNEYKRRNEKVRKRRVQLLPPEKKKLTSLFTALP